MKKDLKPYKPLQLISAISMIMALLWLTISTPFVYNAQQKQAEQHGKIISHSPLADSSEEEDANPFGNNTEEKNSNSSNSFSEEYLHDHHSDEYFLSAISQFYKCENSDAYVAYHGELDVPPPDEV